MLIWEMDKVKDPAMMLSIANTVGLVGTAAYLYKQMEAMRADQIKITQTLQGVITKLAEIDKDDRNKREALHALSNQLKDMNEQMEETPTLTDIDSVDMDLSALFVALTDNNIEVERPSQKYPVRRPVERKSRYEVEDSRDRRSRDRRESGRLSRPESFRDPVDRPVERPSRPTGQRRETKPQTRPNYNNDDDNLLISSVRDQT